MGILKGIGTLICIGLLWVAFHYFDPLDLSRHRYDKDRQQYLERIEKRRKDYTENRPELTERIKEAILYGRTLQGMTREQVFVVLGEPNNIIPRVGSWGIRELWIYKRGQYGDGSKNIYYDEADFYFENDTLILFFIGGEDINPETGWKK